VNHSKTNLGEKKVMKFIWQRWTRTPSSGGYLGHGICIYDRKRHPGNQLIAFVEGYEWYHGRSEVVIIHLIKPDVTTTTEILQEVRGILEAGLKPKHFPNGMLTPRIEAVANA
jgi:hypothetical protein